ncbi:MAG: ATP phosphoribosyltransferase regulatory subunit [Clostridiales bacterium]|nr:ATP phosphoribosyltransferase regulatory subunit [Clostridiales bacterium]
MKKNRRVTPEGMRDLLFEDCLARRKAESLLADLFMRRGFSEVMTPGMEYIDAFGTDIADDAALPAESMYKLTDQKGRLLVMRPDNTIPIARLTATRLKDAPLPVRLFYAQDVYRFNPGMTGRSDQEFQAGVELIGAAGERADMEMIALSAQALKDCGTENFRIEIGHAGVFSDLIHSLDADSDTREEIHALIESKSYAALGDLLDSLPDTEAARAVRRLPRLFGGEETLEEARTLCQGQEAQQALEHLSRLYRSLSALGLSEQVTIDLGLVHRREYYTGVIFRGYIAGSGDTVVSGGRYDTLLERFGRPLPAVGFGINVDAITRVMRGEGKIVPPSPPEILVYAQEGHEIEALRKLDELTGEGRLCEFGVLATLEDSLNYAARRHISQVFSVGETLEIYERVNKS